MRHLGTKGVGTSVADQDDLATKVPATRTVAGKALTSDVTLAKADVGLGSVDNTSDSAKPISTATQSALTALQAGAVGCAVHGSNASFARPTGFGIVIWVGSVTPTNLGTNDIYIQTA